MDCSKFKKELRDEVRYHRDALDILEGELAMISDIEDEDCESELETEEINVNVDVECENFYLANFISEYISDEIDELVRDAVATFYDVDEYDEYFECNCDQEQIRVQFEELEQASKPLIDFLNKYYDPMCKAIVTDGHIEIVCCEMEMPLEIRD